MRELTKFFKKKKIGLLKQIIKKEFTAPNIIIAGGVGSFEPRKISLKEAEELEEKSVFYAIRNKEQFKNKKYFNFWRRRLSFRLGSRAF